MNNGRLVWVNTYLKSLFQNLQPFIAVVFHASCALEKVWTFLALS